MSRVPVDVRRRELVDAAITVMARDGIAKATTRAIVTEAGVHLGLFHYCFKSKEDMLLRVIETLHERHLRAVLDSVDPQLGFEEMVRAALREYWARVEQFPAEHQLTYELTQYALRNPALAGVARRQYELHLEYARAFLAAVAQAAGVRWTVPLDVLARKVQSAVDGVTLAWIVDRDTSATLAVLDLYVEQLVAFAEQEVPQSA
ncbi:TetR/AcrR family transcriptional regulator [Thermocrispum municipale]|jgi:AcrR family transcriptional regulator|uniref:TetR/AcrR family transcriptional regulator n=1 Tax=Thermocrispum municipale TaxID=37926 RepID=UPI00048DCD75|nr:TetR/AcrR family transcriptional regulator [Thermocrispum municipale]